MPMAEEASSTIFILAEDVIFNILSRLPVKSLQRFKCVSKSWNLLIADPSFIRLHLDQNKDVCAIAVGIEEPSDSFADNFSLDYCPLEYVVSDGLYIWGSCHGLLCVARYNPISSFMYTLYLWNPSTREYKSLSASPKGKNPDTFPVFGLGYNSTSMDYEIVEIVDHYDFVGDLGHSVVYVYSVKKNIWRRIQDIPYLIKEKKPGTLVNGKLHWNAYSYATLNDCFIAFDLRDAEFHEVSLPVFDEYEPPLPPEPSWQWIPVPKDDNSTPNLYMTTLDGKLCAFGTSRKHAEIWVMNAYGVKESWTKLLRYDNSYPIRWLEPLCCVNVGGAILMLDNWSGLSLYDAREMSLKSLRGDYGKRIFSARMYTPSLVQVGGVSETAESCTRLRQPMACQENKRKRKDLDIKSSTGLKRNCKWLNHRMSN